MGIPFVGLEAPCGYLKGKIYQRIKGRRNQPVPAEDSGAAREVTFSNIGEGAANH
jgi:hypothetical protein